MKFDYENISSYLRYGFIEDNDNTVQWITSKQITDFKGDINNIILDRFYFAAEEIKKQSILTQKKIFLALSWWIDSLLIYKVFNDVWMDFDSINIAYNWHYSEKQQVLSNIDNENIQFIEKDLNFEVSNELISNISTPNIISHPTIIAYKDLIEWIPENSLLVTGDLWDEIFWATDDGLVNFNHLPEYLFTKDELNNLFKNEVELTHIDIQVDEKAYNTEIFTFYNEVTYNMWQNLIDWKNIDYIPFYKYFINLSWLLRENNLSTKGKDYLYKLWEDFWLLKDNLVWSWIKYPVNEEINLNYLSYIKNNIGILVNKGIDLNLDYLESLLNLGNVKSNKWKLFSLIIFIKYIENNDTRFYTNQR